MTYRIKVGEKENYGDGIFQTKKKVKQNIKYYFCATNSIKNMNKHRILQFILLAIITITACSAPNETENSTDTPSEVKEQEANLTVDAQLISDLECRSKALLQSVGVDIEKPDNAQIDPDDEEFRIKLTKINSEYLALMDRINKQYDTPEKMLELEEQVTLLSKNCNN